MSVLLLVDSSFPSMNGCCWVTAFIEVIVCRFAFFFLHHITFSVGRFGKDKTHHCFCVIGLSKLMDRNVGSQRIRPRPTVKNAFGSVKPDDKS